MLKWHWRLLIFDRKTNNFYIAYYPESFSIFDEAFNHLEEAVESDWIYDLYPEDRYFIEDYTLVLEEEERESV